MLIRRLSLLMMVCPLAWTQPTNITVGSTVLQSPIKRFGINLGNVNLYDSGQMMKNLIFANPSFEGEIWNSTVRCNYGTATYCQDDDPYSAWPTGFWPNGAKYSFFYGSAQGRTGTLSSFTAANGVTGGGFTFADSGVAPAQGDYMIVSQTIPGNAAAGWWPYMYTEPARSPRILRTCLPGRPANRQWR